jgi:hypothetical protein
MFAPGKFPDKVQPEKLDISFLGDLYVFNMDGGGGHVSLRALNVTWTDLCPLTFIFHF